MTRKEREDRLKVLRPRESQGSGWDRYALEVARHNKRVEAQDMATVSAIGFVALLVVAWVLHFFHVL